VRGLKVFTMTNLALGYAPMFRQMAEFYAEDEAITRRLRVSKLPPKNRISGAVAGIFGSTFQGRRQAAISSWTLLPR
jgi:hypothetical protein